MVELTLDQALKQGVKAHKAGQVHEAYRLYKFILKAQPNQPDANHNMGSLLLNSGDVEDAIPFFKTALEANFSAAQYWFSYIDALFKLGRYTEASELLVIAKNKGCKGQAFDDLGAKLSSTEIEFEILIERFLKLIDQGEITKVLELSENLLKDVPDSLSLLNVVSLANEKSGNFAAAIENYKKILKIKPDYPEAYSNMGNALKDQGKLEKAIEAYNKALAIKPDYAEAYNNIGVTLKEQGKLEEAIEAYNKALAIKPDYADAYYNMGNTLKEQGKLEAAIEAFSKAVFLKPDYTEAWNNIIFPLRAIKTQITSKEELSSLLSSNSFFPKFESFSLISLSI